MIDRPGDVPQLPQYAWTCSCPGPEDTERLGRGAAAVARPGMTIALIGELGAGKTFFVQAFAQALGVPRESIVSPTFVICHHLPSRLGLINHLDVYRLADEEEFLEVGAAEILSGSAINLVEWGDRVLGCLPPERWEVTIALDGPSARTFHFLAAGAPEVERLHQLERTWS